MLILQDEPQGLVALAVWAQVLVEEMHLFAGEGQPVWCLDLVDLDQVWGLVPPGVRGLGDPDLAWGPAQGVLVLEEPGLRWDPGLVSLDLAWVLGHEDLDLRWDPDLVVPDLVWVLAQEMLDQTDPDLHWAPGLGVPDLAWVLVPEDPDLP